MAVEGYPYRISRSGRPGDFEFSKIPEDRSPWVYRYRHEANQKTFQSFGRDPRFTLLYFTGPGIFEGSSKRSSTISSKWTPATRAYSRRTISVGSFLSSS